MKAFTDTTITKAELLKELEWHQAQDNFVRGWYFRDGKGCAVGCSLESIARTKGVHLDRGYGQHKLYEQHTGIPEWLAHVEDTLFERMSIDRSKTWPVEFIKAINEGADLEKAKAPFMIAVLEEALCCFNHTAFPNVKMIIDRVAHLWAKGGTKEEFSAAAKAVYVANAVYASNTAVYAAYAADAVYAANASNTAVYAAYAADAVYAAYAANTAYAAEAAAKAAVERMADKLLRILNSLKGEA
jgi:hypothetical protein